MSGHYTFKTLFYQVRDQKKYFWRSTLYGIASTLLLLPVPLLIPLLIDEVLLGHPGKMVAIVSDIFGSQETQLLVVVVAASVILLRAGAFLFGNLQSYYAQKITQRIGYLLRYRIMRHLERVSLKEYETLKAGGIASKTIQDVEGISGFVEEFVGKFASTLLMVIGIAVVMVWMNWVLALLVFIINPFFLAFARALGKKTVALRTREFKAYELYEELLNETLELFMQVRASNQEQNFFGLISKRAKEIEDASLAYGYKATVSQSTSVLLTNMAVDIFRALGVVAVAYSDLSIGMMIAFLFYLSVLVVPVQQLMGLVIGYQNTRPAFDRINALLSLEKEPHYVQKNDPFKEVKTTAVSLKHISFSYSSGKEVLHDITIKAEPGQKIALIGSSGSGKSTIAQVMVGLYLPQQGAVSYGNIPIDQIGLDTVRHNVALMLQESLFFNDTIRMNLTFGRESGDEALFEALKMAQLDTFVKGLEEGLDTLIGKNGMRLSGGQKQRLAIARLILSNPKVVIFDEATSALDNATEYALYQSLEPFLKERTTFIIAHRTTTIRQADTIYLIEDGRVKARGSYGEMAQGGWIKEDYDVA